MVGGLIRAKRADWQEYAFCQMRIHVLSKGVVNTWSATGTSTVRVALSDNGYLPSRSPRPHAKMLLRCALLSAHEPQGRMMRSV